jgi:hypothetical protein
MLSLLQASLNEDNMGAIKEMISNVTKSTFLLISIVNDILDYSQL